MAFVSLSGYLGPEATPAVQSALSRSLVCGMVLDQIAPRGAVCKTEETTHGEAGGPDRQAGQ
jgi:hypothetical protein